MIGYKYTTRIFQPELFLTMKPDLDKPTTTRHSNRRKVGSFLYRRGPQLERSVYQFMFSCFRAFKCPVRSATKTRK